MASKAIKEALQPSKQTEVAKEKSPAKNMLEEIAKMQVAIKKALPPGLSPERFQRVVLSAFSSNPKLQNCSVNSFLAAMMQSAQLGLEPNTPLGQAYLIPYETKYGWVVQFQIGYKGLIDLALKSGQIKTIYAHTVYENDVIDVAYGIDLYLKHKPCIDGGRGKPRGYYAVYHTVNGGYSFEYMSKAEVESFAQTKSKAYNSGPWKTDFDAMAKKTVVKKLLKYAPLASETQRALTADETIKTYTDGDIDMLDKPNEENYIDVEEAVVDEETGEVIEGQSAMQEATATVDKPMRGQLGFR